MPIMMHHTPDEDTPARLDLFGEAPTIPGPVDRHWFVPAGPDGMYCAACNLPQRNRRHAAKAA